MAQIKLHCDYCGNEIFKEQKEVKRRLYNNPDAKFYCNNVCGGLNQKSKTIIEIKKCPICNKNFECKVTNKKTDRTFCSRSCASRGSVTEKRILASIENGKNNLKYDAQTIASGLRSREWWKYEKISKQLIEYKVNHQFEYAIENSIFDLAIIDKKILIEFDGPYHQWLESDSIKTKLAKDYGWELIRIETLANEIIPIEKINFLIGE